MKTRVTQNRTVLWTLAALAALAACGDNLIADPSFDLWCEDELCKPWRSTGKVTRVGTWHDDDYGVSLGDGATLSQLTKHDPVECIAFEVIADVSASADVWIEMDFLDDGVSEYTQLVPESHFAKLRYLVKTPSWYDSLRFILRKKGKGRAVLAQIKATPSDECKGEALPLLDRPRGGGCDDDDQCKSGACAHAPALFQLGLAAENDEGDLPHACSLCKDDSDCAAGELCGAAWGDAGGYRSCIPAGSLGIGMWCVTDDECKSGTCSVPGVLTHGACATCASDDDCDGNFVCGVGVVDAFVARACVEPGRRRLGELCAVDAECQSGACNEGSCAECNAEHPCKGGKGCGLAEAEWLTLEAKICDPASGERSKGAACTHDDDCVSGQCDEPEAICQLCLGDKCDATSTGDCGFLRRLAGTCR